MSIHRRQRRGALLLICLVLLVLFLMLGITFVLTATSFRKGQASNLRAKEFEDRSEDILDKVMMDLLRGSTNPRSPFRGHSLLGDVYGNVSLKGRIQAVSDANKDGIDDGIVAGGGQFMKLKLDVDDAYKPLRNFEDYYAGLVLTMLTGPAKGQSTRVVEFDPPDRFVVLAFNEYLLKIKLLLIFLSFFYIISNTICCSFTICRVVVFCLTLKRRFC